MSFKDQHFKKMVEYIHYLSLELEMHVTRREVLVGFKDLWFKFLHAVRSYQYHCLFSGIYFPVCMCFAPFNKNLLLILVPKLNLIKECTSLLINLN